MTMLTEDFQQITLSQALEFALATELVCTEPRERMLVACFADGLEIGWKSEYLEDSGDDTPQLDWEAPTVWARRAQPPS